MDATSNDLRSPYPVSLCTLIHIYSCDQIVQSILLVSIVSVITISGNYLLLQNEETTQYSVMGPASQQGIYCSALSNYRNTSLIRQTPQQVRVPYIVERIGMAYT